ncbi:hypothetical protein AVEN_167250-1, partial [Araneus ventricosus]
MDPQSPAVNSNQNRPFQLSNEDILTTCQQHNTTPVLKILQINLQKCEPAMNKLQVAVPLHNIDIILAQEPLASEEKVRGIPLRWRSWTSRNQKAAIICPNPDLKVISLTPKDNCVAIKIHLNGKPTTIVSAYSSPLEEIEPTLLEIQDITIALQNENLIVGADLNGHHTSWGYNDTSPRGRAIEDLLNSQQLILLNTIDAPPTFYHTNSTVGRPDLTFTSSTEIVEKTSWQVLKDETKRDHNYILISVHLERVAMTFIRFKTKYGGHKKFHTKIKAIEEEAIQDLINCTSPTQLDRTIASIHHKIIETCKSSYKTKKQKINKPPNWWTPELEIMKKRVSAFRRRAQRATEQ